MKKLFYSLVLIDFFILLSGFGASFARSGQDCLLPIHEDCSAPISIQQTDHLDIVRFNFEPAPCESAGKPCNSYFPVFEVEEVEEESNPNRKHSDGTHLFLLVLRAVTLGLHPDSNKINPYFDTPFRYGHSPRYLAHQVFRL